MNSHEVFIHIHQGCFAGTGAIVRLPQCQWSKPDGYGKISQCITTTKHSKSKTVCIFLGIYCNCGDRQTSKISRIKFQNLNVSRVVLQMALPNTLTPGIKSRMKMFQLHQSDQQFHCILTCDLYQMFYGISSNADQLGQIHIHVSNGPHVGMQGIFRNTRIQSGIKPFENDVSPCHLSGYITYKHACHTLASISSKSKWKCWVLEWRTTFTDLFAILDIK